MPVWVVWLVGLAPLIGLAWLIGPYFMTEELISAAREGDASNVRFCLALGADPNEGDELGRSPLGSAISRNHVGVARLLLERGADPNAKYLFDGEFVQPTARQAALERHDPAMLALLKQFPTR